MRDVSVVYGQRTCAAAVDKRQSGSETGDAVRDQRAEPSGQPSCKREFCRPWGSQRLPSVTASQAAPSHSRPLCAAHALALRPEPPVRSTPGILQKKPPKAGFKLAA